MLHERPQPSVTVSGCHGAFCPGCGPVGHWSSLGALQLKSRFVSESRGSSGNQELATEGSGVSVGPGFLLARVRFTPARQACAGCGGSPERGHSPHTRCCAETGSSPTRPGAGALAQKSRPSRSRGWCWGGSTLTQLAAASGPAGTLPASSCLGRKSSFHFMGNGVVCPVTQWFMCPPLLGILGPEQRQPGSECLGWCLQRSPCHQKPFPMGTLFSPRRSPLAPTWRRSSSVSPPAVARLLFIYLWQQLRRGASCSGPDGHKLKHRKFCLNTRKNFFPLRVTEPWPRLPREAVESPSLEIFQPRLDAVLCSCSG